jgi:hypothetical protein
MGAFLLLARHFFGRFFDNDIVAQDSDMRTNAIQALGFVAVPGMFVAFSMLPSSPRFDHPFANGWNVIASYYFFVVYSMVVMGFVMVFEWDALFPDRRDYIVITPLPLGERTIFWSKLAALIVFLGLFLIDANIMGLVLGTIVTSGPGGLTMAAKLVVVQAAACLSGGAFVAMSFAALQGLLINCLTARAFRRVSPWAQMASMAVLIVALFLTPFLAMALRPLFEQHSPLLRWYPPFWFLSLYLDNLPGHPAGTMFHELAGLAPRAVAISAVAFAVTYFTGYWRHARRVMDGMESTGDPPGRLRAAFDRFANSYLLPHPLERATFHFITNTMLRSARHRLFLATVGGVAIAITLPTIGWLGLKPGSAMFVFTPAGLLTAPLILTFLCVVGLRAAFNLPAELRANWLFQTAESEGGMRHIRAARKWIVVMGLLPMSIVVLPVEIAFRGWEGVVHLTFAVALGLVLLNALLIWFRKIPFTCSYFPGKMSMGAMALVLVVGFVLFVLAMARLETNWMHQPFKLAAFYGVCAAALAGLRWLEDHEFRIDDVLIYEDEPEPAVRTLELG